MSKRPRFCQYCGIARTYFDDYDTFGCIPCDVWLEMTHNETNCADCPFPYPPAKPSLARGGKQNGIAAAKQEGGDGDE